jgi:hypothetical protein
MLRSDELPSSPSLEAEDDHDRFYKRQRGQDDPTEVVIFI